MPPFVTTPQTVLSLIKRSSTVCCNKARFFWLSSCVRIACLYRVRSAWARVARTAGPLRALSVRNWMPARSVASAMAPPSASISLTMCPLPIPPMAGLHDICPSDSTLWVTNNVLQPWRAEANAASVPACPPPITITSKDSGYSIILLPTENSSRTDEESGA